MEREELSVNAVYSGPSDPCGHYGNCGANTGCSNNKTLLCQCLKEFKLKSQHNQTWHKTCVTSSRFDCKSEDKFMKLSGIKFPDFLEVSLNESMNLRDCDAKCLKNCSCIAYAISNVTGGGSGYLMWFGDLIDIKKITNGMDVYIRMPASEQEEIGKSKDMPLFDMNMSMEISANELCHEDRSGRGKSKDVWLPLFSIATVSAATNNFSTENKLGEGGFGPVHMGKLLNGQEVAVKMLSRHSGQGLEELKNETMLIAKLQHMNHVRVLGCCIEQGEKILIYEYSPNKSLDLFLFDPTKKG